MDDDKKPAAEELQTGKTDALQEHTEHPEGTHLSSNQGVAIGDNHNSLKAGPRGPTLLEDFLLREKITHFDHERIPERVVHARGAAAHGYFQLYESLAEYTTAAFLQDPSVQTPVFVRFSTVAGSRGSADTVRDVRGFAAKFYTTEGIFDLVGNNMPVFFIQDAIKFPDLIHAVKPEPYNEIPQASTAHDTFWDFISLMPESMHMIMWAMSDRALPRSLRMMEGFGIHTFRLINAQGHARFVKFHWKPALGVHSRVWDEMQKLAGKDADIDRRDLWEAIEQGSYPEWELGLQIFEESEAAQFDFDVLDPTKLIPEELVPVRRVGKMVLNRNPDNYFAETEQVAFHPGHVVPGIDFSNDPLLQGRLFSYTDTQLTRLGGPNFAEIPINRPLNPVHNNQRDGYGRQIINRSRTSYEPNSLGGGCPMHLGAGAFQSYAEQIEAPKVRERSERFNDYFTQATLFWASQSPVEQQHMVSALQFELSKLAHTHIRQRMVELLVNIAPELADQVAPAIGITSYSGDLSYLEQSAAPRPGPQRGAAKPGASAALSMASTVKSASTRKVAILAADGVDGAALEAVRTALTAAGAMAEVIAPTLAPITTSAGATLKPDHSLATVASVLYDAVFVPGGANSVAALAQQGAAILFINEAYKHFKPLAASGAGVELLEKTAISAAKIAANGSVVADRGVVSQRADALADDFADQFITAIAAHRHWDRPDAAQIPA